MKRYITGFLGFARGQYGYLLWSLWLVLALEFLSRSSLPGTLRWALFHFPALLLNTAIIGGLLLLLTALTKSPRITFWTVSTVFLTAAAISGVKLRMLNTPLLPSDYLLLQEATDVVGLADILTVTMVTGLVIFVGVAVLLLHRIPWRPPTLDRRNRLSLALVATVFLAAGFLDRSLFVGRAQGAAAAPDPADAVRDNGFVATTAENLRLLVAGHRPALDTTAVVARVQNQTAPVAEGSGEAPETQVRPNILIVLSETFWDPTRLPNVTFSQDPLPFYHQLAEQYSSGWMLSPQFGGGTANVEMEVLTGLSMRFLPAGSVPYMQQIKNEVDSLASILARDGYATTAISPWPVWFFNSEEIYRNFGFDRFISEEFIRPIKSGWYIADSEVAHVMIEQSERAEGPFFIYANTAENHLPFRKGKFPNPSITVQGLTGSAKDQVEAYAQGAYNADRMLQTLVEHYSKVDEPTILVWFGDHLPSMGTDLEVYQAAGYVDGPDDPDFIDKMYRVPVLVWNNYLPPHRDRLDISPSFLGPYVLELAERPGTPFTNYLYDLSQRILVIPPSKLWDERNIAAEDLHEYEALQYDILFGERELYGDLRGRIVNPAFLSGYGSLSLQSATVSAQNIGVDGTTLTVRGQNLPPTAVAYVNGTPQPTTWGGFETLSVRLPRDLSGPGTLAVQVRVISPSNQEVVAESNRIEISIGAD